jgi:hypothetical protein
MSFDEEAKKLDREHRALRIRTIKAVYDKYTSDHICTCIHNYELRIEALREILLDRISWGKKK